MNVVPTAAANPECLSVIDRLVVELGGDRPIEPACVRDGLTALAAALREGSRPDAAEAAEFGALVAEVWECLIQESDAQAAGARARAFLERLLGEIRNEFQGAAPPRGYSEHFAEARREWGVYLDLLSPDVCASPGGSIADASGFSDNEAPADESVDVAAILALFGAGPAVAAPSSHAAPTPKPKPAHSAQSDTHQAPPPPATRKDPVGASAEAEKIPAEQTALLFDEADIREAYLADASEFLEAMETRLDSLSVCDSGGFAGALAAIRGSLHTMKGASGSVGLSDLSKVIHACEERIEDKAIGFDRRDWALRLLRRLLLEIDQAVAALRRCERPSRPSAQLWQELGETPAAPCSDAPSAVAPISSTSPAAPAQRAGSEAPPAGEADGLIRVKTERVDALMDTASELLAQRNAWSGRAEALKSFASAARYSRHRLAADLERLSDLAGEIMSERSAKLGGASSAADFTAQSERLGELSRRLSEQAEDLAFLAENARAAAARMADEASGLARVSSKLWLDLQAIRVVPVKGMFQRLARVVRQAAEIEGREVDLSFTGEDEGLDRSLQDQVFESLLHLARNAVGHGIEPPEERVRSGKSRRGRVTFRAASELGGAVLQVSDDGKGLEAEAIVRKARKLGLLGEGERASVERIHQLIFEPGFSTRESANEISGRGVGMDVVARGIEKLRGSIAVESRQGAGTTVTVRLPAQLSVRQTLVVRTAGRLVCIPLERLERIDRAAESAEFLRNAEYVDSAALLGGAALDRERCPILRLKTSFGALALGVESIEGVGELVVKPPDPLLAGHPIIDGCAVSGSGEAVFSLDIERLPRSAGPCGEAAEATRSAADSTRADAVLVVDDSLSVRNRSAKRFRELGLRVDEASDGVEALELARKRRYQLVLTDLEMPKMDGLTLLSELARGAGGDAKLILTSTRSDPETQRRAERAGAHAFLAKPIEETSWRKIVLPLLASESRQPIPEPRPSRPGSC